MGKKKVVLSYLQRAWISLNRSSVVQSTWPTMCSIQTKLNPVWWDISNALKTKIFRWYIQWFHWVLVMMKLNAATELYPVSWPEFSTIHPFAPQDRYRLICKSFMRTRAVSLWGWPGLLPVHFNPIQGQGEFVILLAIKATHESRSDMDRDVALIPCQLMVLTCLSSDSRYAGGCDSMRRKWEYHRDDIRQKAELYKDRLALFDGHLSIHAWSVRNFHQRDFAISFISMGGMVYMDGANMNAQVGLTNPANIGADVCHLNLQDFLPSLMGRRPGVGPICCNDTLKPFLPDMSFIRKWWMVPGTFSFCSTVW